MQGLAAVLAEGRIESSPAASGAFNIVCHCYIKIQLETNDVNMRTTRMFVKPFSAPCPPVDGFAWGNMS
jgi:hypothetical protein